MATQEISATAESAAPANAVWDVLADATRYDEWSALDSASYEREGSPSPHGVGAIRVFGQGRYTLREEVTGFLPAERLDYRLLSGMPVRDYLATVSLLPGPSGGTRIEWRATFRAGIPGTGRLIARKLETSLQKLTRALAAEAESRHGAQPSEAHAL